MFWNTLLLQPGHSALLSLVLAQPVFMLPKRFSSKAVIRVFDKVLLDPRVHFFGNVTYGVDIHHKELRRFYDQIIYAVGAQADRRMGIPGEELPTNSPATAFVGWYNGHPDYRELPIDLSCERAVVVGNGNVAMDVTRILVMSPDTLLKTDIADHALEKLRGSKIREVLVLGDVAQRKQHLQPLRSRNWGA